MFTRSKDLLKALASLLADSGRLFFAASLGTAHFTVAAYYHGCELELPSIT